MPYRKSRARVPFRPRAMYRKRKVPDLVPFTICRDCFTTFPTGNDPCTERNAPSMTTVSTVVVDGGAFSSLGNAVAGMSRGQKFRGMKFDLRLAAGYRTSNSSVIGTPAVLHYAIGLSRTIMADGGLAGRVPGVIPNLMATSEELFNTDLMYLKKGRVYVPAIAQTGGDGTVGFGTNDGVTFVANGHSPGGVIYGQNALGNQIHHSVRSRRNLNENEAVLLSITAYAEQYPVAPMNSNDCANVTVDVHVVYDVEGMIILENWPS